MKKTLTSIIKAKNERKLVVITAYDALFGRLFNESADIILVGDSLSMSFGGHDDTLSATLDMMIYHTNAVARGATLPLIVTDMPFGTYLDIPMALKNGVRILQETPAHAVKIEGGKEKAPMVKALVDNGIAVMGHIGLLPQSVRAKGGYKVRGKDDEDIKALIEDAQALEQAGAFSLVIEGVKRQASHAITQAVSIPTIGIGAGEHTDGQVLVFSDMLGLYEPFTPKFVKKYLQGASLVKQAIQEYADEVQHSQFPSIDYTY